MGSFDFARLFFPVLIRAAAVAAVVVVLFGFSACTDYERAGVNPRPFNEPTQWEQNPYGDAFRN